jgi:hypothetical protein
MRLHAGSRSSGAVGWLLNAALGIAIVARAPGNPCRAEENVSALFSGEQFARKTIYHSPQTPGYTCWVGAWLMPDRSLMVTFKQATGPLTGRQQSTELLKKMGMNATDPARDFTGLELANIYLRSTDGGTTWDKTSQDVFPGPLDRPAWGGSHCALRDGAILRAVDGSQLPLVPGLPRRIYFQRSHDLGKTWDRPEIPPEPKRPVEDYLGDFGDCISRVRRLRDGRLMATGVIRPSATRRQLGEPLVMFSDDDGESWIAPRLTLNAEQSQPGAWNEWDSAELPGGEFLCVFRRSDSKNPSKQVRWQGLLRKQSDGWAFENYGPSVLEHSGHPEVLATREGIVLHIATTGIHWTADRGTTWNLLNLKGLKEPYQSRYYPKSVQTEDGQIFVFAHVGWDNAYGQRDQSIVMDSFRLTASQRAQP